MRAAVTELTSALGLPPEAKFNVMSVIRRSAISSGNSEDRKVILFSTQARN